MKFDRVTFLLLVFLCVEIYSAPKKTGAPASSPLELARNAYENGRYTHALDLLSNAINSAPDATSRNKAYYYQGMVLFELGLFYSSYLSFRNVLLTADDHNREVYEKAVRNAIIITDKLKMVDKVGKVLVNLPGNFLPTAIVPMTHYAIGVYYFQSDDSEKASSHLKSVNPESPYYMKALFHLGILATKRKDYKESIFYFEKIVSITRGKREHFAMNELAKLNLARSIYSAGQVEKSIETYSQFLSSSPYWLSVLLEASWPLMRVNDTTVSLGNLHTVLSPFYREDLVGEAYVLRATILFSLCKYEEMRRTLAQFFDVYDPVVRAMQQEVSHMGGPEAFYNAFSSKKLDRAFSNYAKRDPGVSNTLKVLEMLREERQNLARLGRNEQMKRMAQLVEETERSLALELGSDLQRLHKRKLADLLEQREQANYLKVEIVTGEKELIEGNKGLPPKRIIDVETSVAEGYHFWPYDGEYWDDELGTYVYTTESACVN